MRAGQDLPCCGVLAPVRCGGWDGVWLVRCGGLQHQATPLVQADAAWLSAYPGLLSKLEQRLLLCSTAELTTCPNSTHSGALYRQWPS